MTRTPPPPPETSHGWTALQTYADEHVSYATANRPCVCGHGHLYHCDRFDHDIMRVAIGVGRCTNCDGCHVFRPADAALLAAALLVADAAELPAFTPTVLADIAAVRADLIPSYSWSDR